MRKVIKMKTMIQCTENKLGGHAFYVKHKGTDYLLFNQKYHNGVDKVFCNGLDLRYSLDPKTAKGDTAVLKTITKMKMSIKYIEREFQVKILDSSINKGVINKKKQYKEKYRGCYTL